MFRAGNVRSAGYERRGVKTLNKVLDSRTARILVVDDDALIAMSAVDMLEDLGHKVAEAHSGKQALTLLAADEFDLVMTDYAMPGMNGAELAAIVQQTYPGLPVLIASGYAELPAAQKSKLPRIAKPYLMDHLRRAIDPLLQRQ